MTKESFLLVSLEEDKAKKLAQVISNDTARKILDYLSRKNDTTETDLASELKLPLSTVHYNMQQLVEAKLVNADKYHYSKKGKEVLHYELSNKYVIIAPKTTDKLKEQLKRILPVVLIVGVVSALINFFSTSISSTMRGEALLQKAPAPVLLEAADTAGTASTLVTQQMPVAAWFFIGAIFAIIVFGIWILYLEKKK